MKNNITPPRNVINYKQFAALLAMAGAFAGQALAEEATSPWSLEAGVGYNIATKSIVTGTDGNDINAPKVNTYGFDLTGVYTLDKNHSFNVRLGFATGSKDKSTGESLDDEWDENFKGSATDKYDFTLNSLSVTVGYRYTGSLTDTLKGYVGANIGIAQNKIKYENTSSWSFTAYGETESGSDKWSDSASAVGLAYSLEAGLSYTVSSGVDIFLAYQLAGNTAQPKFKDEGETYAKGKSQLNHGIRAGVNVQF